MRVKVDCYEVVLDAGRLSVLRYGEKWRDCTGDNLIYCLAAEVEALRGLLTDHLEGLKLQIEACQNDVQTGHVPSAFCPMERMRALLMVKAELEQKLKEKR